MKDIIKYDELSEYIMFKLNKLNNITEEDLLLIDELNIDYKEEKVDLNILNKFKNIKILTLKNYNISKEIFYVLMNLSNLEDITFERCSFNNCNIIAGLNIKELSLINCLINNYDFVYVMEKLEKLEIINGTVEITKLNRLTNLEFLLLSDSEILDPNHNIIINKLKEIYIDNTNINDLNILNNLNNLEYISLDKKQIKNNKELINTFKKKNISIYEESIYEIGDENEN